MLSLFQVVPENTMEFVTCIVIHDLIIYSVVVAQHMTCIVIHDLIIYSVVVAQHMTCIVIHDLIIYIAGVVAAQHRAIESSSAEKTFGNFNLNLI